VAFAGLALLTVPVRELTQRVSASVARWNAARLRAGADRRLWALARTDARVMADLQWAVMRSDGIERAE
jgi:hypothetical protein